MRIPLDIRIGFGAPLKTMNVSLTAMNVGQTAAYAGANHILRVDEHFHDYVELLKWSAFPSMPAFPTFPHSAVFTPVVGKRPSTDVAGTLGEGATAIVLKRLAHLRAVQLVTLGVTRTAKTPDFAVQLPRNWMATAKLKSPAGVRTGPQWWPVEAKACQGADRRMTSAAWKGFQQLVSYWRRICLPSPNDVGFGIVVVFKYDNLRISRPRLSAHVFLPSNQPRIRELLAAVRVVSQARATFENRNLLHAV